MAKKTVAAKKRNVKVDGVGQLHVHSSFNNIIVCLANSEGQVISWSSAGKMGFRGSKKNTPYAAQMAAQDCAKVALDLGLTKVKAYVKGKRFTKALKWLAMEIALATSRPPFSATVKAAATAWFAKCAAMGSDATCTKTPKCLTTANPTPGL